jgi:hypothetical protein
MKRHLQVGHNNAIVTGLERERVIRRAFLQNRRKRWR